MLIPTKAKSSHEISILASFEEKADSSGGGTTYVPVVALEYTLPGPIGGHRLPAPQSSPPQSSTTGRQRLPRHCNFRPKRYLRNTLAGESFNSSSSSSSLFFFFDCKCYFVESLYCFFRVAQNCNFWEEGGKERKKRSINFNSQ